MISMRDMDMIQLEAQETFAEWVEEFFKLFLDREGKNGDQGIGE